MFYPIILHKDAESDYGVTVPDLPGCFTAGSTLDEAVDMAREAIELHLEGMIEDGDQIPRPTKLEALQSDPDCAGGWLAVVPVDPSNLRIKVKRIQVTMPERTLSAIDRYAMEHGGTRSGILTEAAIGLIGNAGLPTSARGRPVRRSYQFAEADRPDADERTGKVIRPKRVPGKSKGRTAGTSRKTREC